MRLVSDTTALRRLHPDDLHAFLAYRNDPVVAQYQSWDAMDTDEATGFLSQMASITPLLRPGHWTQIAIAEATSDALLGDMGLHLSRDSTEAEMGITLSRAAQGHGHATRSVALAAKLLFDTSPITHIRAWADTRNTASCRLMLRAGFKHLGVEVTDGLSEDAFVLDRPIV